MIFFPRADNCLLCDSYKKAEDFEVVRVPLPELREDDVLVKVKACGVCGTGLLSPAFRLRTFPEVYEMGANLFTYRSCKLLTLLRAAARIYTAYVDIPGPVL